MHHVVVHVYSVCVVVSIGTYRCPLLVWTGRAIRTRMCVTPGRVQCMYVLAGQKLHLAKHTVVLLLLLSSISGEFVSAGSQTLLDLCTYNEALLL